MGQFPIRSNGLHLLVNLGSDHRPLCVSKSLRLSVPKASFSVQNVAPPMLMWSACSVQFECPALQHFCVTWLLKAKVKSPQNRLRTFTPIQHVIWSSCVQLFLWRTWSYGWYLCKVRNVHQNFQSYTCSKAEDSNVNVCTLVWLGGGHCSKWK